MLGTSADVMGYMRKAHLTFGAMVLDNGKNFKNLLRNCYFLEVRFAKLPRSCLKTKYIFENYIKIKFKQ